MGDEYWRNAYRPLLPGIQHYDYNCYNAIDAIDEQTACVILETVQAESGVINPDREWLKSLSERCKHNETLLILDEVQCGFGRTGTLWAFEQYNIVPDILLLGKALGGGMPLGAFIADKNLMKALTTEPVLGHISTFGGHPVSCAAGLAALKVLINSDWIQQVKSKEKILAREIPSPHIIKTNTAGLWASLQFTDFNTNKKVVNTCIKNGLITDWFLFAPECLRIAPPLCISDDELKEACGLISLSIKEVLEL